MQDNRHSREREVLVEHLRELAGSPQWEAAAQICLGREHPLQGEVRSVRDNLVERHRGALRDNDLAGARYWIGKVEMLEELFQGQLIALKIKELIEGGQNGSSIN